MKRNEDNSNSNGELSARAPSSLKIPRRVAFRAETLSLPRFLPSFPPLLLFFCLYVSSYLVVEQEVGDAFAVPLARGIGRGGERADLKKKEKVEGTFIGENGDQANVKE